MTREVLQLALEALEEPSEIEFWNKQKIALVAIKAALAQPYPEYDRGFSNGWDKCAARQVTQPALPPCHSDDAAAFIEKHLALRNYPANSRNAARAGWDAACDLLTKIAQPVQPEQDTGLPSLKDLKRSIRHRAKTEGYPCHFCGKHFCNHGCLKD